MKTITFMKTVLRSFCCALSMLENLGPSVVGWIYSRHNAMTAIDCVFRLTSRHLGLERL